MYIHHLCQHKCEDQSVTSDQNKSTAAEPPSPAEILNQFKIASLGCSVGLESRSALRSLICDTQPNTELSGIKFYLIHHACFHAFYDVRSGVASP